MISSWRDTNQRYHMLGPRFSSALMSRARLNPLFDSYETASMGPSPLTVALWGSCCGRVRCVRPATLLGP
eukprot:s3589_g3.t2